VIWLTEFLAHTARNKVGKVLGQQLKILPKKTIGACIAQAAIQNNYTDVNRCKSTNTTYTYRCKRKNVITAYGKNNHLINTNFTDISVEDHSTSINTVQGIKSISK